MLNKNNQNQTGSNNNSEFEEYNYPPVHRLTVDAYAA